jgi:hypothetical protein
MATIDLTDARRRAEGGRVPPHNLEAEESLLGSMMPSPGAEHSRRARGSRPPPDEGIATKATSVADLAHGNQDEGKRRDAAVEAAFDL